MSDNAKRLKTNKLGGGKTSSGLNHSDSCISPFTHRPSVRAADRIATDADRSRLSRAVLEVLERVIDIAQELDIPISGKEATALSLLLSGSNYKQIGETLNCCTDTARSYAHKALERLSELPVLTNDIRLNLDILQAENRRLEVAARTFSPEALAEALDLQTKYPAYTRERLMELMSARLSRLPYNLGFKQTVALEDSGIRTLGDLCVHTREEIAVLPGVRIVHIDRMLRTFGLSYGMNRDNKEQK